MSNFNSAILNRRLPQFLGIFTLIFSIVTISYFSTHQIQLFGNAATGNTPKDIRISNIDTNSFTVSYVTDENTTGSIAYGKDNNLGQVSFDTRDGSSTKPSNTHYIKVSNLNPSTKYFFSITSGSDSFPADKKFKEVITTSKSTDNINERFTVSGKIILVDGKLPTEAIIYVESVELISTIIKANGEYSLDLTHNETKKPLNMTIITSKAQSKISFLANQADPLPPVILSKNYDFTISNQPLSTTSASSSAKIIGFPTPDTNTTTQNPQILTPGSEQEFKDQKPLFEGKAPPGSDVEITIQSEHVINATVKTNNNGVWQYRPSTPLTPGKHTITIKTLDANRILRTITQSFTVFAQGSQFVEPSISPTVPPTAIPTTTPTVQPTAIVTAVPTPIIIEISPSVSAPTTPVAQITTPPIPNAGNSNLLFGIFGLGSIIGIGSLLFFLL